MGEIINPNKKSIGGYTASISFLAVVIILTAVLYFYNYSIGNEIEGLKKQISDRELSIKTLEQEQNLQVYSLLELNKNIITSYELMNKVTTYINHMDKIAKKYDLEFNGFNLAKGEIITNVKVISDKHIIAYEKIRDFISKYRLDSNRLFELEFINSFEGMDNIKFRVNFKIK